MPFESLSSFIQLLEAKNELVRVKEFVSPELEITEITDRFSKHNGKALLFENTGTAFPLLINAMGTERRMCLALGVESLDDIGKEIMALAGKMMMPRETLLSKLAILPALAGIAAWMPRSISGKGKCQEVVVNNPDLSKLPVLTCWPFDGGPFITLPVVHTRHPESGLRNVGMYRMQVMDKDITGMHWHLHKNSASHYREYKRLGKRMPVAVTLGGDPAYTYSATAPLPENVDEYLLAGFLRKKRVEMVKCLTSDLEVPCDVDFVIEGYVDPSEELVLEGPFGDHTGFYSLADYYPKFHVTCITHRKDAIYPTTIVGIPPQEDAWIGKATERIFLSPIRLSMLPEITDMVMPVEGVFHNIVLAGIRKSFPGQASKVMSSLWGAGQMMFNKVLVVLDDDVNLNDYSAVMKAISENADVRTDLVLTKGPVDVLDHSSSRFAMGSKFGIDATRKWDGEVDNASRKNEYVYSEPNSIQLEGAEADVSLMRIGIPLLIVRVNKTEKMQVRSLHDQLAKSGRMDGLDWVIYVDEHTNGLEWGDLAWMVANNIDPMRDCFISEATASFKALAIDGTMKTWELDSFNRDWPNILTMSEEVIRDIDRRWESLGLGEFIPSPTLRYARVVSHEGAVASRNHEAARQ